MDYDRKLGVIVTLILAVGVIVCSFCVCGCSVHALGTYYMNQPTMIPTNANDNANGSQPTTGGTYVCPYG